MINRNSMSRTLSVIVLSVCGLLCGGYVSASQNDEAGDVAVMIVIGQSNADGSAMFDPELDSEMKAWYESPANPRKMKIWYRSSKVENQASNALGEAARWVVDGDTADVDPGWLDLWYRNENTLGRTAMNMIHGYGTWSIGGGTDCAQGRRGMEGAFGKAFAEAMPETELYVLKLGVSGSFISSWANPADDHNWNYFCDNIFRPAMADLIAQGKRPKLAGVWWMQGCADSGCDREYYRESLKRLVGRVHDVLCFPEGKIYVGHVVAPGESSVAPDGSTSFSRNVRAAQDDVAAEDPSVEIVETGGFDLQYEDAFGGYIHFSHSGVNAIGRELARRVLSVGPAGWAPYVCPVK